MYQPSRMTRNARNLQQSGPGKLATAGNENGEYTCKIVERRNRTGSGGICHGGGVDYPCVGCGAEECCQSVNDGVHERSGEHEFNYDVTEMNSRPGISNR